jgi:RNA recognition motif-containing protein
MLDKISLNELEIGGVELEWNLQDLMLGDMTEDESEYTDEEEEEYEGEDFEDDYETDEPSDDLYLWVGQVGDDIQQDELWNSLSEKMGALRSLNFYRQRKCAVATFQRNADATKSLRHDGALIGQHFVPLHVGKSSTELLVSNLEDVTPFSLRQAFERYGVVTSVRVLPDECCGFVAFSSPSDALEAVRTMEGRFLGNKKISVIMMSTEAEREVAQTYFGYQKNVMKSCGPTKTKAMRSRVEANMNKHKSHQEWSNDILHHKNLTDDGLVVPSRSLFVSNIRASLSLEQLKSVFARFGEIAQIVPCMENGYAFVCYKNLTDAANALRQMTLLPPVLSGRHASVKFGTPLYFGDAESPSAYKYTVLPWCSKCRKVCVSEHGKSHREIQIPLN